MSLDEAVHALVPDQGVDLIAWAQLAKCAGVKDKRRLTAGHCAFLAGEGEVVVAGNIIPLAVLMPDHYHTILP